MNTKQTSRPVASKAARALRTIKTKSVLPFVATALAQARGKTKKK